MVPPQTLTPPDHELIGSYPESPAGPIDASELAELKQVPEFGLPRMLQVLRFGQRQAEFMLKGRKDFGDVFRFHGIIPGHPVVSGHPDHARSLFTAKPELVPTLTSESPLRPIVGPNSVLTSQGDVHLRQRRLLLPAFHGPALDNYQAVIERAIDAEIDRWQVGETIPIAGPMQDVTLEVILSGIFGIERLDEASRVERKLAKVIRRITELSTTPIAKISEYVNVGRTEPVGVQAAALKVIDNAIYDVIAERRADSGLADRSDIMSALIKARDEDGSELSDSELRDQLLTLLLAGHETTANSMAWAWERLTRTPDAYEELHDAVRNDREDRADQVEYVIQEAMRARPVVPIVGRRVQAPWRLGEYGVPAGTPVSASIFLIHHREDLYPQPWEFKPERWVGHKPGTYEWLPFGGGMRRCAGAALAMVEMRVVIDRMAERLQLEADRPEAEHVQHRNVTMIPKRGARVIIRDKR
ncbi:MAG: cytochrome P450 [Thermoleophilaceae bacterium]|nr:cytochrome P450 [Thermoleophilaceae bacterium]